MGKERHLANGDILMLFNYAARLVAIESDGERIFGQALEALSVLADYRKVALYTMAEEAGMLQLEGIFADRKHNPSKIKVPYRGTPFEKVIEEKEYGIYPMPRGGVFGGTVPVFQAPPGGVSCLCLPLSATSNDIMGVVAIENDPEGEWPVFDIQMFITFTTLVAVSIENSRLYNLATIDGLTRLFVRTFFEVRLEEEIARIKRSGGSLSVILADIDKFKEINDIYGHQQGDAVLKGFAAVLESNVRKGIDIPCRFGGDEFTLLVVGAKPEDSLNLARRIQGQFEAKPFPFENDLRKVTISAGIASVNSGHMATSREIMDRADQMLYRAKGLGRNRVCLWEDKS